MALQSIRDWLAGLGLERYAEAFESNDVDVVLLPELSEADLQQLGVSLGHRKRMLAALRTAFSGATPLNGAADASTASVESVTAEGERRQVTVLFCDLVGSTALSHRLDPEIYRDVLARYHERCIACVQRFEGFVAQIQGDGVVAYFGYPLAHEGEAERAIRAALAIMQALDVLDVGLGEPLRVRIGIASGLVVVSHVLAPDKSAVGETPNLAYRLQSLARPGEIVTSEGTRALAGGVFDYAEQGQHMLKGIAEAVQVWQVMGTSGAASRFEAATGGRVAPIVGRDPEIALLLNRWELSRSGEGQVILLQGEPGIGKSRMLRAFREQLGDRIETALQYQCSPYYVNSAFYPIIDHLERALRFSREDSIERKLDKLERRVVGELRRTRTDCQLIARAMALPAEARYGVLDMSPQRQKEETTALLVDIVAQIAGEQASVVLFEDIHWADPSTIEVLNALIDRTEKLPLLVLLSFRPEFEPPWLSRSHVTFVGLTRLSRAQGASIVLRVAGNKPLPADLVEQIVDKTDGVPLFLEELTKTVLESDLLADTGGRYEYADAGDALAIPATLRDSLMARLDRLIPVKEIAQIGACLGREFSYELVRAVSPMDEAQLNEALDRFTASELVFRRGTPPEAVYIFKHALVQDAAYDSLLKSKRQSLHAQIASAIREHFPSKAETEPELLAHHYTEAGLLDEAIVYWHRAGDLAQHRFALPEAVNNYRRASRLLELVETTQAHMERQIDIAVKWADLIVPSQEVISALETAAGYAERLGDLSRLSRVAGFLGQILFYLGKFDPAAKHLRRVIEMSDRLEEKDRVGSAYRCLGQLYLFAYSRCSEGLECIEQAMTTFANGAIVNHFEQSCCQALLGLEFGYLGHFGQSTAAFDRAINLARDGNEHSIACWDLMWRSSIHCLRGEWRAAAASADEGVVLARRIENVWALHWCKLLACYARFATEPVTTLIEEAEDAFNGLAKAASICISTPCCHMADILYAANELDKAELYADRALGELSFGTYFSAELRAYRVKSMIESRRYNANLQTALGFVEKATSIARQQQRIPDLAICQLRHAELLLQQGSLSDARSVLLDAMTLFTELKMAWWLGEAAKVRKRIVSVATS